MSIVFVGISFLYECVSKALTVLHHVQLCYGTPVILTRDLVHGASQHQLWQHCQRDGIPCRGAWHGL